jgi:hypothetical protein
VNIPDLNNGDVDLEYHADRDAFVALASVNEYNIYDFDWDWENIQSRSLALMNRNSMIAWATPQHRFKIKVSLSKPDISRAVEKFSAVLQITGVVCLCGYTTITMCAQFDNYKIPQPEDGVFRLPHGLYEVTVYSMFEWDHWDQFAVKLNEGDHYIVVFKLWESGPETNDFRALPWMKP